MTYSDQVEIAKDFLKAWIDAKELFGAHDVTTADGIRKHRASSFGWQMLASEPDALLAQASTSAFHFDAVKAVISKLIERDEFDGLPRGYRIWLAQYLSGEIQRPKSKAGRLTNDAWHTLISWAVDILVRNGMTPTRNDASEPISACDAVADALTALGRSPETFEGVKRVWLNCQNRKSQRVDFGG